MNASVFRERHGDEAIDRDLLSRKQVRTPGMDPVTNDMALDRGASPSWV